LDLPGEGTGYPEQAMPPAAVRPAAIHHWVAPELEQLQALSQRKPGHFSSFSGRLLAIMG